MTRIGKLRLHHCSREGKVGLTPRELAVLQGREEEGGSGHAPAALQEEKEKRPGTDRSGKP
jgi:hypothetical protein